MSESTIAPPAEPFYIRYRYRILFLITLAAALLRFATLGRPTLWGDEALTYSRVIGSWDEMFSILRTDGFMPLHYVLYWILGKFVPLTPAVMRIIPSICGTLMVPAIYFLVRQIASVQAALLAAGFACTSAYLNRYSHDAKMYIQTWCFVTINIGCFFWWLRTNKWLGYAGWIVSGIIAGGFSALAMIMVLPQVIIFFTARKFRLISLGLFFTGVIIIAAPVAIYMSQVNHWAQRTGVVPTLSRSDSPGNWEESGVSWIEWYNAHATGTTLVRGTLSGYLTGWEWPHYFGSDKIVPDFVLATHLWFLIFIAAAGLLALLPWKKSVHVTNHFQSWQRFLWIILFLLIPIYGIFYCRSVPQFNSPRQVISDTSSAIGYWRLLLIPLVILYWYFAGNSIKERMTRSIPWMVATLMIFVCCQLMYEVMRYEYHQHWQNLLKAYGPAATPENMPQLDWKSIWMPRYAGVVTPIVVAGVSLLVMRLPGRWVKGSVIVVLIGFNLAATIGRLIISPEPPLDRFMTDAKEVRDTRGQTRTVITSLDPRHMQKSLFLLSSWYGIYGSAGKYYASITLDLKPTPEEFREGDLPSRYRNYLGEMIDPEEIEPALNYQADGIDRSAQKLIVWDHSTEQSEQPDEISQPDHIVQVLSKNWKQIGTEEIFYQYESNCWAEKGFNRRRVFVKK